jgi:DNA-binding MarR family transcriptional regulator
MQTMSEDTGGPDPRAAKPKGIAYLIGRLDHVLGQRLRDRLALLGLTLAQYTALSVLDAQRHLSNAQLAERTMISPQSANEMVKAMDAKGWIERQPDANHGRIVQIRVTDQGKALLRECDAAVAELERIMLAGLDTEQQQRLGGQLKGMLHALIAMML